MYNQSATLRSSSSFSLALFYIEHLLNIFKIQVIPNLSKQIINLCHYLSLFTLQTENFRMFSLSQKIVSRILFRSHLYLVKSLKVGISDEDSVFPHIHKITLRQYLLHFCPRRLYNIVHSINLYTFSASTVMRINRNNRMRQVILIKQAIFICVQVGNKS